MALNEGQMVSYAVEQVIETVQAVVPMAERVETYTPPGREMQRSDNQIWMPLEQQSPTQRGWDLTNKETDILELSVSVNMADPDNDFFTLRADDLRDEAAFKRRVEASAVQLASNVEKHIADTAIEMGSLVVTNPDDLSGTGEGWDMMSEAEALLFARELDRSRGTTWFFNPQDYRKAGYDLARRDMFGRLTDEAYRSGEIGKQVAGFEDVLRSPKLKALTASTATGLTVTGDQSFRPVAYEEDPAGGKRNVDHRFAVVHISGAGLKRGDKISFAGVKFISQLGKDLLTEDATFSVAAVNGNDITITPKPIALNDPSLTPAERAYANVNTSLADGTAINVLNVKTVTPNVFWANDSIRLVSQPIPATHKMLSGMRVEPFTIPGTGLNGVIAFQGNISKLGGDCRIALWYQASAVRPEAIGVGLSRQA